jgi:hypothetical protein
MLAVLTPVLAPTVCVLQVFQTSVVPPPTHKGCACRISRCRMKVCPCMKVCLLHSWSFLCTSTLFLLRL